MKVPFPKNIQKGILSGMTLNLGPISLSIVQLLLVAVGVGLGLAVFNAGAKAGSKAMGVIFAIPVLGLFLMVAFFKISELSLIAYVSKLFRNRFFDTTKKYQVSFEKFDNTEVLIKEAKIQDKKVKIEQKENTMDVDLIKNIEEGGLI